MGTFKSQSVTCYTVSTACDIIKTFDINVCDVSFVHYFQIIYIDLQPISKNSLTLLSAEYGFYFISSCSCFVIPFNQSIVQWFLMIGVLKMTKYDNPTANQSSVYHSLVSE